MFAIVLWISKIKKANQNSQEQKVKDAVNSNQARL